MPQNASKIPATCQESVAQVHNQVCEYSLQRLESGTIRELRVRGIFWYYSCCDGITIAEVRVAVYILERPLGPTTQVYISGL